VVFTQTNLGQISIAPWTDQPPPREKNKLISSWKKKKRHVAKRVGHHEHRRGGGAIPHRTINKQDSRRRQELRHTLSNQERENL
jgi:hypothetical protein